MRALLLSNSGRPYLAHARAELLDFLGHAPSHTLLVSGSRDQYCPVEALERLGMRLGTTPVIIDGAEHFFSGKLFPLSGAVERWLRSWTP